MSETERPSQEHRETASRAGASEAKGAVVITSNGMPEGYTPPSASLAPAVEPASPTQTGEAGADAGASTDVGG
jgi:hypothetical protein